MIGGLFCAKINVTVLQFVRMYIMNRFDDQILYGSEVIQMSDSELIALLNSDPAVGIRVMVDTYSSMVYTIAYSKLRNVCSTDDIEEFVGYVFGVIYNKRQTIDFSRGTLKGFVSGVAKQLCIDEYRRVSRNTAAEIPEDYAETAADSSNIQEDAERRLDEERLKLALRKLNKTDRMVLIKRYYFNQTSVQIARDMNSTDVAVRKRISRAIEKMRKILTIEDH